MRNDAGLALEFVEVIATFYAADGSVVDADFTYANPSTLAPGLSTLEDLSATTAVIQAEGNVP